MCCIKHAMSGSTVTEDKCTCGLTAALNGDDDAVRTGCKWAAEDMDNSYWESSCGGSWEFNDGGVQDNGLKYCPFCSGKIIEALNGESK